MRVVRFTLSIGLYAVLAAACASTPRPAPTAVTPVVAPVVTSVNSLTADQIVALQKEGYRLVTSNGETLYCRNETKTGSRVEHEDVCMTAREALALREETKRNLQNVMMQRPPPQGK